MSGLGCGPNWRMCPEASRLVAAHGQEPLVVSGCPQVLTGSSSACPAPGWALGLAREGVQPELCWPSLVLLSGRCVESCMRKREREEATSDREPPAHLLM